MENHGAKLKIEQRDLDVVNQMLAAPDNKVVQDLIGLVEKFGGAEEINRRAEAARDPESLMGRLKEISSPYVADLEWLMEQRDKKAFVPMADYYQSLGVDPGSVDSSNAVTLEISAMQFFPWLIDQAKQAVANRELMPGRVIRVRNMAEQAEDNGDILASTLAMQIIGASHVETLDTRGTDGSNIHLAGGPDTILGFLGGVGQPNDYPLKWVEEYLHYYTTYGVRQVLNINPGTVLAAYMLHRLGVDIEFKISVFAGNDNPLFIMWTLMTAKLFARQDGTTSLIGLNLSNSVDNETFKRAGFIRSQLGLEQQVRFEHHITNAYKSCVQQPYYRLDQLIEVARDVPNISAKIEGGEPDLEETREHQSDAFDYFMAKQDILDGNIMAAMRVNYLDKHATLNRVAQALLKSGIGVIAAQNLH